MPVRKNPKDISKNNVKTSEKETIKISSKKTKEKDNAVNETNQVKKDGEKLFKKCPNCGKEIDKRAIKCQYCKKFLTKAKIECPFCFNEIDDILKGAHYVTSLLNDQKVLKRLILIIHLYLI